MTAEHATLRAVVEEMRNYAAGGDGRGQTAVQLRMTSWADRLAALSSARTACLVCRWPVPADRCHICECCGFEPETDEDADRYRATWDRKWCSKVTPPPLIAEAPREEGWQPIATAPKDGTRILAYAAGREFEVGLVVWRPETYQRPPYHTVPGHWVLYGMIWEPTKWMPLPTPPLSAVQAPQEVKE